MAFLEKLKNSGVEVYEVVDGSAKFMALQMDEEEFLSMVTSENGERIVFWFIKEADYSGNAEEKVIELMDGFCVLTRYNRWGISIREGSVCEEYWEDVFSSIGNEYEKELEQEAEKFIEECKEERLIAYFTPYKGVLCGIMKYENGKSSYEEFCAKMYELKKKYENKAISRMDSLKKDLKVAYNRCISDLTKGLKKEHREDLLACKNQILRKRFVRQLIEAYCEEYNDRFLLKIPMGRIQEEAEEVVRLHRSSQNGI